MSVVEERAADHPLGRRARELVRGLGRPEALPVAATALVAATLALRTWVASRGWFHLDDLVFVHRAHLVPFDASYLLTGYAGHLMPGSFVLVSLLTALAPLSWPVVVVVDMAGQLLVDLAALRLLATLFGRRPAILLPFAVFLCSSLTLPASTWWAAALNQLPQQLATLVALTELVRHLRTGRRRHAVTAALAVAAGLLFSERTVLAIPLLAAVALLWFADGPPRARAVAVWRRARLAWLLLGGVGVAYGAYYLGAVPTPFRGAPAFGATARAVLDAVTHSVLPGLLGGPWAWAYVPRTLPTTDPPAVLEALAVLVSAAVVAASLVRHRGAGRAWALLAAWLVIDVVVVAATRGQVFAAAALVREYRYLTELGVVGMLAVGLAFLPVRSGGGDRVGGDDRGGDDGGRGGDGGGSVPVLRPRSAPSAERLGALARPEAGAAAVALLLLGALVSGAGYAAGWADNPARDYVRTARAALAAAPGTVLVDRPVPDAVMWGLLVPYNRASVLLSAVPEQPRFLADGGAAARLETLDDGGRIAPARVVPDTTGAPGPVPGCGWPVLAGPTPVPTLAALPPGRRIVRVGYLSALDHLGWIDAGGHHVPVLLPAGLRDVYVQVDGPVDSVTTTVRDPVGPFCVGLVEVGSAAP